jgi:starch synthase (maltosyl-transferring)
MKRVIIKNISHDIENGRFRAKETEGDEIKIFADIFSDGHDAISSALMIKFRNNKTWKEIPMNFISNDKWQGSFVPNHSGIYVFNLEGWINHYTTWKNNLIKNYNAGNNISMDLKTGFEIFEYYLKISKSKTHKNLILFKSIFEKHLEKMNDNLLQSLNDFETVISRIRENKNSTISNQFEIEVNRAKSVFSSWYELFPRSTTIKEGGHGTFNDMISLLPEIASNGFDTIYLPPIHPIGITHRKGKNNSLIAEESDPGSPWAIGSKDGGHKSINKKLGTLTSFKKLVQTAKKFNIEIALDIAFQCSPDHPYIKEHPEWFKWRPDGTIQFAENPPKKYEDIVPFYFETESWKELWEELKSIVDYWINVGITIFRVDNPHTKPLPFWHWMINEIKKDRPDIIFLAEAFTRPRIMEQLAMSGFDQSYTYFSWRNTKEELEEYMNELTSGKMKYYFRPNFWPNTPDILPPFLVEGGENGHIIRAVLAATLSSNYGIYGPVFEYGLNQSMPGKEEYIDNEKYEIKVWDWQKYSKIKEVIKRINKIRRDNIALQRTNNILILPTSNQKIICYAKYSDANKLIIPVNLDPFNIQEAQIMLPLEELNLTASDKFRVNDLLSGDKFYWQGEKNYVKLNPNDLPAHILRIEEIH